MSEDLDSIAAKALREIDEGSAEVAVGLCERVIVVVTKQYGEKSREAFRWRGWKGKALVEARRFDEAEEIFEKLLEDRWATFGPDDSETLSTRGNLADTIARAGRPLEAIVKLQFLLDDRIRLFGRDAREVLTTHGKIAHAYHTAGNYAESVRLYEELYSRQMELLGSDHPDVLITESNLLYIKAQKTGADFLSELEHIVDDYENELEPTDLNLLTQQHHLAVAYYSAGRFDEALSLINDVVVYRTQVLGPLDQRTIISTDLRAMCKLALGDIDSAVIELSDCANRWKDIGMEKDQNALETQRNLINALLHAYTENSPDTVLQDDQLRPRIKQIIEGLAKSEPDHHLKVWLTEIKNQYPELFIDI